MPNIENFSRERFMFGTSDSMKLVRQVAVLALLSHKGFESTFLDQFEGHEIVKL